MTVVKLYAVNHLHGCLQVLTIGYYGHIFSVGLPNKCGNKLLADNVTLNSSSESNRSWSAGLFRCILLCSRHAARTARFNRRLVNFLLMMQPEHRKRWTTWLRVTCFQRTLTFTQIFYTHPYFEASCSKNLHIFFQQGHPLEIGGCLSLPFVWVSWVVVSMWALSPSLRRRNQLTNPDREFHIR